MKARLTLVAIGQITEGVNKKGNPYRFATCVFETLDEKYPKQVAMKVFNTELENLCVGVPLGSLCDVDFDISSREFNGKWYTDITAIRANVVQTVEPPQPQQQPGTQTNMFNVPQPQQSMTNDNLPF